MAFCLPLPFYMPSKTETMPVTNKSLPVDKEKMFQGKQKSKAELMDTVPMPVTTEPPWDRKMIFQGKKKNKARPWETVQSDGECCRPNRACSMVIRKEDEGWACVSELLIFTFTVTMTLFL